MAGGFGLGFGAGWVKLLLKCFINLASSVNLHEFPNGFLKKMGAWGCLQSVISNGLQMAFTGPWKNKKQYVKIQAEEHTLGMAPPILPTLGNIAPARKNPPPPPQLIVPRPPTNIGTHFEI